MSESSFSARKGSLPASTSSPPVLSGVTCDPRGRATPRSRGRASPGRCKAGEGPSVSRAATPCTDPHSAAAALGCGGPQVCWEAGSRGPGAKAARASEKPPGPSSWRQRSQQTRTVGVPPIQPGKWVHALAHLTGHPYTCDKQLISLLSAKLGSQIKKTSKW